MVTILESHLRALAQRAMILMDSTRVKTADAIETICQQEPEEVKYEIMQRCTTVVCNRKSKEFQEKQ